MDGCRIAVTSLVRHVAAWTLETEPISLKYRPINMKSIRTRFTPALRRTRTLLTAWFLAVGATMPFAQCLYGTELLKAHGVFSSNMILQRGKPIKVWGWGQASRRVVVRLGEVQIETDTNEKDGAWEVVFEAREASNVPVRLTIVSGGETIEMDNILFGDVWVMNGQSNMAWGLKGTLNADLESAQSHLPLLRQLRIGPNEHYGEQRDIPTSAMPNGGWVEADPESALEFSAIGYVFGSRLQRALRIPVGIIDNARGGASIESLVPYHKFDDDPIARQYLESVEKRRAEFDWDAEVAKLVKKWENKIEKKRVQGVIEDELPPKPTRFSIRSWSIPGKSPSDAASCYNGMFGAFKGFGIKGVLFHQGYNNAMQTSCRPRRYRVLTRLMIEGWREDFSDPQLPVGIIGFCAGGIPQTTENFETWTVSPAAYIREAQRLGVGDTGDLDNTAFLPAHDVQVPGLHPAKKLDHGNRAARWALKAVYDRNVHWETASLVSAERELDEMVLTFDKAVMPDDMSTIPKGFAIAGEDGKFYFAHARFRLKKDQGIWNTANKSYEPTIIHVWSPLVKEPIAVRYAWARSPLGNLKVGGKEWAPLASFRTDDWDWPESDDPIENLVDRGSSRSMQKEAEKRNADRRAREASMAEQILTRLQMLGRMNS